MCDPTPDEVLSSMMRTRSITGLVVVALLTVYGALPCLVAATAAMSRMDAGAPMAPCDAADAPSATLLCATPTAYAPLSSAASLPSASVLAAPVHAVESAPPAAVVHLHTTAREAPPGRATPAFLLHASLLI